MEDFQNTPPVPAQTESPVMAETKMSNKKKLPVKLVVVGIMLLIFAAGGVAFKFWQTTGSQEKMSPSEKTKLKTLTTALEVYRSHKGQYPKSLDSLVPEYVDKSSTGLDKQGTYIYTPDVANNKYVLCIQTEKYGRQCVDNLVKQ